MLKIIVASNNTHKIGEIKDILKDISLDIYSLKECNIDIDVLEDGKTFKENAYKKAKEIKDYLVNIGEKDFIVMSDDSGLEVEYLNKEPGVFSARYAGEHGNDKKNNEKLLKNLSKVDINNRQAEFVCSIVLITWEGKELFVEGRCKGIISYKEQGKDGFGYDPLFYIPSLKKTFAQLTLDEKNKISHRGLALKKLKDEIKEIL
ncbi:MAG: XTP/dITP diphosphatase [Clostridium perfringens]|nr:XTP/dITP diphosphatase [Clostridium perfringens]